MTEPPDEGDDDVVVVDAELAALLLLEPPQPPARAATTMTAPREGSRWRLMCRDTHDPTPRFSGLSLACETGARVLVAVARALARPDRARLGRTCCFSFGRRATGGRSRPGRIHTRLRRPHRPAHRRLASAATPQAAPGRPRRLSLAA